MNLRFTIYDLKRWSLVFAGYVFVVFLLCVLPVNGEKSSVNQVFVVHVRLDYWIHMVMFMPWMGLALIGNRGFRTDKHYACFRNDKGFPAFRLVPGKPARQSLFFLIAGILFAIGCESIQFFIPWRTFNINDLLSSALGVLTGIPIIFFLHWNKGNKVGNSRTEI